MAQNPNFGVNVVGRTTFQVTTFHVPSVRYGAVRSAARQRSWPRRRQGQQRWCRSALPDPIRPCQTHWSQPDPRYPWATPKISRDPRNPSAYPRIPGDPRRPSSVPRIRPQETFRVPPGHPKDIPAEALQGPRKSMEIHGNQAW